MGNILELFKRKSEEYRCKNPYCQKVFKRRSKSNEPAFCSYECGAAGQPEKCKQSIRNSRGFVN